MLTGQMVFQVVFLYKLLLTDLTLEMSLSAMGEKVLLQTSLLGKCFITDITRERLVLVMLSQVQLQFSGRTRS